MIQQQPSSPTPFEQALRDNLVAYTTRIDPDTEANLFSVHHELSIARFALTQQAKSYYSAIQILTSILEGIEDKLDSIPANPKLLTDIMTAISGIEAKSRALIDSTQQVIKLVGESALIDVDKSALRSLVVNIPSLVRKSINSLTQDENLAEKISLSLNNQINNLMVVYRLDRDTSLPAASSEPNAGIDPQQFYQMMNTVPSQPVQHISN